MRISRFGPVVERGVRVGAGIILSLLIARQLGPEGYGILSAALAIAWIMAVLASLGIDRVYQHELEKVTGAERSAVVTTASALRLGAGLVCAAIGIAVGLVLRGDDPVFLLALGLVLSFCMWHALEVIELWLYAEDQVMRAVAIRFVATLIGNGARLLCWWYDLGIVAFAACFAVEWAVVAALLAAVFVRRCGLAALRWSGAVARTLIARSWPTLLAAMATVVYQHMDQVMVLELSGEREVGIYSVAARISGSWLFVISTLMGVYFPRIARDGVVDLRTAASGMRRIGLALIAFAAVFVIALTVLGGPLVGLLLGERYAAVPPVLAVLCWTSIPIAVSWIGAYWLVVRERDRLGLVFSVVALVANVGLNLVLIPKHGALGAAWASFVAYGLVLVAFPCIAGSREFLRVLVFGGRGVSADELPTD